ncbi:MAG: GntR family transcriptional regulator [Eubacteriales bacterium]|nr:GntR family transcriptional regulator [Eubacteriales bacterium]
MEIKIESVNTQVYNLLEWMILARVLKPGERIDIKKIAKDAGVSVMPVRYALQKLESQGMVINQERGGFFVRKFTANEIGKIIDMRKMFELFCLDNYFHQINQENILSMLQQFIEPVKDNPSNLENLDNELHKMIVYASNNEFIIQEYEKLESMFGLGYFVGKESQEFAKDEHIKILKAIQEGDKKKATKMLESHLNRVSNEISGLNCD